MLKIDSNSSFITYKLLIIIYFCRVTARLNSACNSPFPDPIDALRYWMESRGLKRNDLIASLGSRGRVSEVLKRKRGLSLSMIRELNEHLHMPAELLIKPYPLRRRPTV